jgi:hypothetical protein
MRFFIPGVLVITFLIPALLPSELKVSEQVLIEAKSEDMYSALVNLESWKGWGLWLLGDNQNQIEFAGVAGVVGSQLSGIGPGQLKGQMTLTQLSEPHKIVVESQVQAFWLAQLQLDLLLSEQGDQTQLQMTARTPLSYPLQRYMALFKKSELQQHLTQSLSRLKWWFEENGQKQ